MVQRAGRIDRLGSPHKVLTIYNMFPEEALEDLLGLVQSLTQKIETINQTGFLDASVLGEVVTPKDFNTLRRIADEDAGVIDEEESFLELASSEAMLAELQKVLATEAQKWITDLDDGIHSGLQRRNAQGVFFYFKAPHPDGGSYHYWRYYDLRRREITDNRYQIMQLIACGPETPRFPRLTTRWTSTTSRRKSSRTSWATSINNGRRRWYPNQWPKNRLWRPRSSPKTSIIPTTTARSCGSCANS
jgi:hypothetical protein